MHVDFIAPNCNFWEVFYKIRNAITHFDMNFAETIALEEFPSDLRAHHLKASTAQWYSAITFGDTLGAIRKRLPENFSPSEVGFSCYHKVKGFTITKVTIPSHSYTAQVEVLVDNPSGKYRPSFLQNPTIELNFLSAVGEVCDILQNKDINRLRALLRYPD
jgi:hypothetical protein